MKTRKFNRIYLTSTRVVAVFFCLGILQGCFVLDWIKYNDDKKSFDIKDGFLDAPFRGAEWKFRIKGNELFIGIEHKF